MVDLFSYDFMPHGNCYLWQPLILWLHVASDAIIGLAYFSIPIAIIFFLKKEKTRMEFRIVLFLFAAFIIACGTNHFVDIYTTWVPAYLFEGIMKAITGLLSIATAFVVWPLIPVALKLNEKQQDKNKEVKKIIENIEISINNGDYEKVKKDSNILKGILNK